MKSFFIQSEFCLNRGYTCGHIFAAELKEKKTNTHENSDSEQSVMLKCPVEFYDKVITQIDEMRQRHRLLSDF